MSCFTASLRLFPGITAATVRAFLMPPVCGVVLETFGAGNAPQRTDLMDALKEACARGVIIVAISQCAKGSVSDAYETGRTLLQVGVIPGGDMTPECALTKLSYLLCKPELTVEDVRAFIAQPLRGELTRRAHSVPAKPSVEGDAEIMHNILSRLVTTSSFNRDTPQIVVSPSSSSEKMQDIPATWTRTAAEAATTEAAILPFLAHLAAAKDHVESLKFCLETAALDLEERDVTDLAIPGGIINCLEPGSGRSPLHVAALNGSTECTELLLRSGALVHLRDTLGHTALYYAARQCHGPIVDLLVAAGANLSGFEIDAGFTNVALRCAVRSGNKQARRVWEKAGMELPLES